VHGRPAARRAVHGAPLLYDLRQITIEAWVITTAGDAPIVFTSNPRTTNYVLALYLGADGRVRAGGLHDSTGSGRGHVLVGPRVTDGRGTTWRSRSRAARPRRSTSTATSSRPRRVQASAISST
jgi:hypothetical protein